MAPTGTTGAGEQIDVLCPAGQLTGAAAVTLKEDVRRRLAAGHDVILDMSGVSFTDSEGLSALVAAYKTACSESRRLVLADARQNLRALLDLTRLHRIFEVYLEVAAARSALREEGRG